MLYLTADFFPVFVPLGIIGFYRYLWFLIKVLAFLVYRPIRPQQEPTYVSHRDVSIIVPTIDAGEEFKEAALSWLVNKPREIIIVTSEEMLGPLQVLANEVDPAVVRVLTVPKANKRLQMVQGVRHAQGDIVVFADDDAIWKPTMLEYILACFEDDFIGGVGTSQSVKSVGKRQTVWEVLAGFRLTVRNIEVAASTHIDGGVCCISGRTAAYRTVILKDPGFQHAFTNDLWCGKYPLNSGDDKFLTRWMISHQWNTYIQVCQEAELLSTFKTDWRFLKQVLRWTRNMWRSDFRSLFTECFIWNRHPYVAYTMMDKIFNPLKLLPHFFRRPQDVICIPAFLVFNYYFAVMKLYALCTLQNTDWGTRAGVSTTLAADIENEESEKLSVPEEDSVDEQEHLDDKAQVQIQHVDRSLPGSSFQLEQSVLLQAAAKMSVSSFPLSIKIAHNMSKLTLVFGVGPGTGAAIARKFAGQYPVALMARNEEYLKSLQAEIERSGGKAASFPCDVSSEASVKQVFSQIYNTFGKDVAFGVTVYNASSFARGSVMDTDTETLGAFLVAKETVPNMIKHGGGSILFTGATASLRGSANFSAFAVGKFGLRALSQSLAREFGPQGIHVAHVIVDGVIGTEQAKKFMPHLKEDQLLSPEQIAETYWFLSQQDQSVWTHELDIRPFCEKF